MDKLPPGPATIVWPLLRYLTDPHGVFPALARRYGDPFLLPIPGTTGTVVTGDPEGVRAVMGAPPEVFTSFRTEATEQMLGEHSLYFQSGAAHRDARRILSPPFHGARMRLHGPTVLDVARAHMRGFRPGAALDLRGVMDWISLEVVVRVVLGVTDDARIRRYHRTMVEGLASITPAVLFLKWLRREFGGLGPWAKARRFYRGLMRLLEEEIAARRARGAGAGGGGDVLGALLRAGEHGERRMSDEEIRDKLYDLIIAGYETTAVALAWAGYEICRHPRVERRLLAELQSLGDDPDPESIARLPYLEAICHEVLRLHPNFVLLTRTLARPLDLKGYTLPPGQNVSVAIGVAHFREETFPRPASFEPERFLDRTYSPFEYLPFGGGAQRCLGAPFALHEMKLVLAALFRRHVIALEPGAPVRAAARAVTVGPAAAIRVVVLGERGARRPGAGAPAPRAATAPS
ncbi:cytochrome P450 [Sorangium sp. So ce131]|uniref:cytochrome P450 n=1 Tax=Sorangium sp. So ce131 TaxID=3133282 RepID=UPI003F648174